jgi:hypothetical protein
MLDLDQVSAFMGDTALGDVLTEILPLSLEAVDCCHIKVSEIRAWVHRASKLSFDHI